MFIPLIQKRRSIRRFLKSDVEPEKIDLLVEAALRAPSSRGPEPVGVYRRITESEKLERLSTSKEHGSSFLRNASLGIVVCADPKLSVMSGSRTPLSRQYLSIWPRCH